MMSTKQRQDRIAGALRRIGVPGYANAATPLIADLERRYAEAHRAYHTIDHIDSCLAWLDRYFDQAKRPAEIEIALWFHDAIYDPTRPDNEARSAELAEQRLRSHGAQSESIVRVTKLICVTKGHESTSDDAALLCSIDLATLGAAAPEYARYAANVRAEYAHVPDALYMPARVGFLQTLLDRPTIYANAAIRHELEERARRNLKHEIAGNPLTTVN